MSNSDKPDAVHLRPQAKALLDAFKAAGMRGLTTRDCLNLTYQVAGESGVLMDRMMGDWRRRKSDLTDAGWLFTKVQEPGSTQYRYVLRGHVSDKQLSLAGVTA